jgi:SAM-dependent methyltransferase
MALTDTAHALIEAHLEAHKQNRKLALDATCGNGYDTEVLCALGFEKVLGFDIQPRAIAATQYRLAVRDFTNARLVCKSHLHITEELQQENAQIDCAMFNLGYLPHGDKLIATQPESSVGALNQTLESMAKTGIVTILCYPGRTEGAKELALIKQRLSELEKDWQVQTHKSQAATPTTPVLFTLSR